jgi:hypothetical protein
MARICLDMNHRDSSAATEGANLTDLSSAQEDPARFPAHSEDLADTALTEDEALALLNRRDLPSSSVEEIAKNASLLKSRKVCIALAAYPHAPRRLSLRLIRQFYTFDLMQFAMNPAVAPDLKRVADDLLIARLPSLSLGERLALARRASGAVAAGLLLDKERRVFHAALENSRITELAIVKALAHGAVSGAFVETVCRHSKWSVRREMRIALLRNAHTPLARAVEFARSVPPPLLRDVLHNSKLPEKIKSHLRDELKNRK